MNGKQLILKKILDGSFALCTAEEIAQKLHLKRKEALALKKMLLSLVKEGELLQDLLGRFGTAEQFRAKEGKFIGNERGFGFVELEGGDLFIPKKSLRGALHGDVVLAFRKEGDEGEILAILSRLTELVGTYQKSGRAGEVIADERKYLKSVFIPERCKKGALDGDKVVVKITSFSDDSPSGEIVEILGKSSDLFAEELSVIRAHSLRETFPENVLNEAKRCEKSVSEEEISKRADLREKLTFTIDGEDTRDIDDAISVEREGKNFLLGVHIADVSNYVRRGSPLDQEAFLRGTSVYFPDRVLPMLPKELSNGICSLNEGEDRLTLTCEMTISPSGEVLKKRVFPSVIRSKKRTTYTEISNLLKGEAPHLNELKSSVFLAAELTKILKAKRKAAGCVDLEIQETKILYTDGEIEISPLSRDLSHEMIEQFMVLANESVAELMTEKESPFLYRVHEAPSEEKVESFSAFLSELGVKANLSYPLKPKDDQKLLESLKGTPLFPIVNRVMLRSMMKARYDPENLGHFGLASKCYCHFTSPIRRYPDLAIHRIIKDSFRSSKEALEKKYGDFVEDAALRSSACERTAQDAERDVDALYIVAYMEKKIGERFSGIVSGVNSFGLFVELENSAEGFLPIETLPEDSYEYLEERRALKGLKRVFRLGDPLTAIISGVDWGSKRVILGLEETL